MYEYKNVTIPIEVRFTSRKGDNFKRCMDEIHMQAKLGWRLVQIFEPTSEKSLLMPYAYEIIFEKKIDE